MNTLSSPKRKNTNSHTHTHTHTHKLLINFLYLTIVTFFVVTVVAIATPRMSNGTNKSIFGSFDSVGASIILIGFPWLCLQYIKFYHGM